MNIILNIRKRARMRIVSRSVLPTSEVATINKGTVVKKNRREASKSQLFQFNLDN